MKSAAAFLMLGAVVITASAWSSAIGAGWNLGGGQDSQGTHLRYEWIAYDDGEEFRHQGELWVVQGRLRMDDVYVGEDLQARASYRWFGGSDAAMVVLMPDQETYWMCRAEELIGPSGDEAVDQENWQVRRDEVLEAIPLGEERQIGSWSTQGFLIKREESRVVRSADGELVVTSTRPGTPLLELWLAEGVNADFVAFAAQVFSAIDFYLQPGANLPSFIHVLLAVHEGRLDRPLTGLPVEIRSPRSAERMTFRLIEQGPVPAAVFTLPESGYERVDCPGVNG